MSFGRCGCSGLPTPFGGPASGLWPSGGGAPAAPPPPPAPPIAANILAECFSECLGVISSISPGPVCGWAYFISFGGPTSTITFSPGEMRFDAPTSNESPAASKGISLSGVNNRTVQFTFQEFDDLRSSIFYMVLILDALSANMINVYLSPDGVVQVSVGPTSAVPVYQGTWAPNKGRHTVRVTVDDLGLPRLWVDGVEITLAFFVSSPYGGGYPDESVIVNFTDVNGPDLSRTSTLNSLFITSGQYPPTQAFACP